MTDRWDHFIAGKPCPPALGRYMTAAQPALGIDGAQVALGSQEDVAAAAAAAVEAAPGWRHVKPIERGRVLMAIAAQLRADVQRLSAIESAETGKPGWQSAAEIEIAAQYFEFYGGLTNLHHGEIIDLGPNYHSYTLREPFGVVAVITPWNAPINQAARGIAPALAAGNVVIHKPSEFTSGTAVELARLASEQCNLPAGVLNVVLGDGAECGAAIVSHPSVRKVAFTGSVRAGREIGRIAADRVIPLTLELGGKSPNIIFDDADLEAAVGGAIRGFVVNAGQVCLAGTRLLVQRSVLETVLPALKAALANVKVGPGPDCMVGAITTKAQYLRVQEWFEIARSEGARALVGGELVKSSDWGEGWFLPPTVYTDVDPSMRIASEEIFGPVLVVLPFEDEADAIRIANDTEYGLAAGLWTRDLSRAHRVASALEAGQIYVNEYQAGGVETPLGGFKTSGYGREKGIEALHHYTQLKCVTIRL